MDNFFGPISNLVMLAVVGLVVYAIVQRRRRRDVLEPAPADPGIGTVRRLYFYTVSFVGLMMAGNGLVQISQYVLEGLFGGDAISQSQTRLAVGVSLTVVGLPLWAAHWYIVGRHVRDLPVEKRSLVRKAYVYVVLGVSIGLLMASSVRLVEWVLRSESFGGYPWGAATVWAAVWAFHWMMERDEGQPTTETRNIRRLYLYLVSAAALGMVAGGLGRVLYLILLEGYDEAISQQVLISRDGLWSTSLRAALATGVVGAGVWASHWIRFAARDQGAVLRQFVLYSIILGGAITIMVSAAFIVHSVVAWLLDVDPRETASAHFRVLPGAVASLAAGIAVVAYHWYAARRDAAALGLDSHRSPASYHYVLAALGVGALMIAVGTLVHSAVMALVESDRVVLAGPDLWREPLAMGITLAIVGAPLWAYAWPSIQRRVRAGGHGRRDSLPRRVYLLGILGAGVLALVGGASALLFFLLRDGLGDGVSSETIRDARVAIDVLAVVLLFLPGHWMTYREDQRLLEAESDRPARASRKDVTVLIADDGSAFVGGLESVLGYRASVLQRADPDVTSPQLRTSEFEALGRRILDAPGQSVLVVPEGADIRVLSYS